jgi:hypothetical protein
MLALDSGLVCGKVANTFPHQFHVLGSVWINSVRPCAHVVHNLQHKVMRSETFRLQHEQSVMKEKIRDNGEKVKQNKVLPYLVGNVVEVGSAVFGLLANYSSHLLLDSRC